MELSLSSEEPPKTLDESISEEEEGEGEENITYNANDELELHRLYQTRHFDFSKMTKDFYNLHACVNDVKRGREGTIDSPESTNRADVEQNAPRKKFRRAARKKGNFI